MRDRWLPFFFLVLASFVALLSARPAHAYGQYSAQSEVTRVWSGVDPAKADSTVAYFKDPPLAAESYAAWYNNHRPPQPCYKYTPTRVGKESFSVDSLTQNNPSAYSIRLRVVNACGETSYTQAGTFASDRAVEKCGDNGESAGPGLCECKPGFKLNQAGQCVPYECQTGVGAQGANGPGSPVGTAGPTGSICGGGPAGDACVYTGGTQSCDATGYCYTWGARSTGQACNPSTGATTGSATAPAGPPGSSTPRDDNRPPSPCSSGTCPGYVNGDRICVPCQTRDTSQDSRDNDTRTNPDGSTTSTQTNRQTSCNGTTCTTTTTTTTTTTGTNGQQTTSTTSGQSTESQSAYCGRNPTASQCGGSGSSNGSGSSPGDAASAPQSSFGGACSGGFTCSGDAIQCAIAREQHLRNCQASDTTSSDAQEGASYASGQSRPSGHPALEPSSAVVDLVADVFGASSVQVAGSCPGDLTFSLMGQTITYWRAEHCQTLASLGSLLLAVTYLVAALFVFGS